MVRLWRPRVGQFGLSPIRLVLITSGFISVYFGFTVLGNRVHQYQLDRENVQLEQKIEAAKNDNARLQALKEWVQSDGFVETMARKQGLVRPGDNLIVVAGPRTATPAPENIGQWWERYVEP